MLLFALCFGTVSAAQVVGRAEAEPKHVLVLHTDRAELLAIPAIDVRLREALAARGCVEVFGEHFDFARFLGFASQRRSRPSAEVTV